MKNIFLYILLFSLILFGCKSTDNVETSENDEKQDTVQVDEVLPIEEEADLQTQDSSDSAEILGQEDIEKIIAEQGDLPLPLYDEFVPITENLDEIDNTDEFFYGDEFVPQDIVQEVQQNENSVINSFDKENLDSDDILVNEQNSVAQTFEENKSINNNDEFLSQDFDEVSDSNKSLNFADEVDYKNNSVSENSNFQNQIAKNNETVDNVIESINPLENEKSVIIDDILHNRTDENSEKVAPVKNSEKKYTENNNVVNNNLEKNTSVEQELIETNSNVEVILEDLEKDISPSRTVYASKNQTIIASYPGNGWVYLGEIESKALVGFKGKTFSSNKTNFKLQPQKEGNTILHFYKLDAINGNYIDDYLEVVVTPTSDYSVSTTVAAPEFNYDFYLMNEFNKNFANGTDNKKEDEVVQDNFDGTTTSKSSDDTEKQDDLQDKKFIEQKESSIVKELAEVEVVEEEPELLFMSDIFDEDESVIADSLQETENSDNVNSDLAVYDDTDLLEQAKTAYSEKDYSKSLSLVNKFLETSSCSVDEALYLKGQILEKPFEQRNIRDALECYKLVISTYPQSDLWDKCDERIKYIQRFYFNIR